MRNSECGLRNEHNAELGLWNSEYWFEFILLYSAFRIPRSAFETFSLQPSA